VEQARGLPIQYLRGSLDQSLKVGAGDGDGHPPPLGLQRELDAGLHPVAVEGRVVEAEQALRDRVVDLGWGDHPSTDHSKLLGLTAIL